MRFDITYHERVVDSDIPKLGSTTKLQIKKAIEAKLTSEPHLYGKPLRGSAKGYWKLRVGEYRVIFRIEKTIVKIFIIAHRSVVYTKLDTRVR